MADGETFDRVVAALEKCGSRIIRRSADQVRARCPIPAHRDHRPSLLVTRRDYGAQIKCFAGCQKSAILRALGLQQSDVFTGPRRAQSRATIVAAYDYITRDNQRVQKVRREPKGFIWRHADPAARTGWSNGLNGRQQIDLHIYRLTELRGQELLFIPEGEKSVDRLWDLGLIGTCGPGGAGPWHSSWTADLQQRPQLAQLEASA